MFEEYRETMKDLSVKPTLSFGVFYAARSIMESNGLSGLLERHTDSYAGVLSFIIASRIFEPSSDIDLIELRKKVYYPWKLQMSRDSV